MHHYRISEHEYRDVARHRSIYSGWEFTPRLAIMRNPGAVHTENTCSVFEVLAGGDCSTSITTVTERPSAYFASLTAGLTHYSGRFFARAEVGGTFRVSSHSSSPDNLSLDTSKDPEGFAASFWLGAVFL